jgi:hypothetical protein
MKVSPQANRCVVFFSDLVEHEVLPAHAHRMAITVWLSSCNSPEPDEQDLLSREFFKLACRHAQAQQDWASVSHPPEQEAEVSRQGRLSRFE